MFLMFPTQKVVTAFQIYFIIRVVLIGAITNFFFSVHWTLIILITPIEFHRDICVPQSDRNDRQWQ